MASLDWSQCPVVESVADRRSGAWVFRDTRTPVSGAFDNLEVGASITENAGCLSGLSNKLRQILQRKTLITLQPTQNRVKLFRSRSLRNRQIQSNPPLR